MPLPLPIPRRHWFRLGIALALLGLALLWLAPPRTVLAAPGAPPAGSYFIEDAAALQRRGLYHFLYVHRGGAFLLAGEWAGNESSRAAGHWTATAGELVLTGSAKVETNQGRWEVPYRRVFRIESAGGATRLVPLPEKNRFGMLGWPDAYVFASAQPTPPFPDGSVPADEARLVALMNSLMSKAAGAAR
jgi:hypothetical protein